jgi:hypothetical protein
MRPNANRAKLAITFIWIVMGFQIVSTISSFFQYLLLKDVAEGNSITPEAANSNDVRQAIVLILFSILYIFSVIFFIQWFRRAYFNQEVKFKSMASTNGWTSGAWFVPILNLFKPFQLMQEMYENAEDYLLEKKLIDEKKSRKLIIGWWWGLWIGTGVISRISSSFQNSADDIGELIGSTLFSMFIIVIFIPLSILTVKTIQNYNEMELILEQEGADVVHNKSNEDLLDAGIS